MLLNQVAPPRAIAILFTYFFIASQSLAETSFDQQAAIGSSSDRSNASNNLRSELDGHPQFEVPPPPQQHGEASFGDYFRPEVLPVVDNHFEPQGHDSYGPHMPMNNHFDPYSPESYSPHAPMNNHFEPYGHNSHGEHIPTDNHFNPYGHNTNEPHIPMNNHFDPHGRNSYDPHIPIDNHVDPYEHNGFGSHIPTNNQYDPAGYNNHDPHIAMNNAIAPELNQFQHTMPDIDMSGIKSKTATMLQYVMADQYQQALDVSNDIVNDIDGRIRVSKANKSDPQQREYLAALNKALSYTLLNRIFLLKELGRKKEASKEKTRLRKMRINDIFLKKKSKGKLDSDKKNKHSSKFGRKTNEHSYA